MQVELSLFITNINHSIESRSVMLSTDFSASDRILMDPGHKARKNQSDNADLGFQAVGPVLRIMQLNVEGLSAAKRCII